MWLSTSNGIKIIGGCFFEALVRVLGKPKLGSKPKACVRLPKGLPKPDFAQKFFACTIFLGIRDAVCEQGAFQKAQKIAKMKRKHNV